MNRAGGILAACVAVATLCVACDRGRNNPDAERGTEATAETPRTEEPAASSTVTPSPIAPAASVTRAPTVAGSSSPIAVTPTPVSVSFSAGEALTPADIEARGRGEPGRGAFLGERLTIPRLAIDVPLVAVPVSSDGQMPSPPSIDTAAWYDFSQFPGLGGNPGVGGNVVIAGDSGRQGVGIGPLYKIIRMAPGDYAMIALSSGVTVCYRAEFNKLATAEIFQDVVQATAEESLSLITAGSNVGERRVVWGRRVSCGTAPTPTPTAQVGHHKLRIVAANNTFTVVEGGVVPLGRHTVDYSVDNRDAGVLHSIAFYDTTGRELIASEQVSGPIVMYGQFGVGPPQPPGRYTFRCSVQPSMTGSIQVLP